VYYEGAVAAVVVVDLSRDQFESSLNGAAMWATDLMSKVMLAEGVPLPIILLGNKSMSNGFDLQSCLRQCSIVAHV
jgi:hypothetical protein